MNTMKERASARLKLASLNFFDNRSTNVSAESFNVNLNTLEPHLEESRMLNSSSIEY